MGNQHPTASHGDATAPSEPPPSQPPSSPPLSRSNSACSSSSSSSSDSSAEVLALAGGPRATLAAIAFTITSPEHTHQHRHASSDTGRGSRATPTPPSVALVADDGLELVTPADTATKGGESESHSEGHVSHQHHHHHHHHHHVAPNMWKRENIGLYTHYFAVGLVGGMSGVARPFCDYVFDAPANLCANSNSIIFLAWNFKIFFALFTDSYKPFGLRRKPYLLTGWFFILLLLLLTGLLSSQLTATTWIVLMILVQFFLMLADVPADGYCVELGHLEPHDQRGQILATGQFIRFMGCVFAGAVQSFLLNGPSTNDTEGCPIRWNSCWSWGLTMAGYYYLLFALVGVCVVPMLWFKEVEDRSPQRTLKEFAVDLFDTCRNLTTTYLLVFVVGNTMLALSPFNVTSNLQYLVIRIPNLLSGIDSMTTYLSLSLGIYIFQKHLINKNWRTVNYCSAVFTSVLGLLWILPFYNVGGLRTGIFTIFVNLDQSFTAGLSQVLFSMTVIELAKPGQEATVYELLISVANSAMTVSSILSTQLLTPLHAATCQAPSCPPDTIDMRNFDASGGPKKSTVYLLVITGISLVSTCLFTSFLPTQKAMCVAWKKKGEEAGEGHRDRRAVVTLGVAMLIVMYGIVGSVLLLDPKLSCSKFIGGPGCA